MRYFGPPFRQDYSNRNVDERPLSQPLCPRLNGQRKANMLEAPTFRIHGQDAHFQHQAGSVLGALLQQCNADQRVVLDPVYQRVVGALGDDHLGRSGSEDWYSEDGDGRRRCWANGGGDQQGDRFCCFLAGRLNDEALFVYS